METTIFEIKFKDGRKFKVFCANSSQKKRTLKAYNSIKELLISIEDITSGIHTCKQFEQFIETLK